MPKVRANSATSQFPAQFPPRPPFSLSLSPGDSHPPLLPSACLPDPWSRRLGVITASTASSGGGLTHGGPRLQQMRCPPLLHQSVAPKQQMDVVEEQVGANGTRALSARGTVLHRYTPEMRSGGTHILPGWASKHTNACAFPVLISGLASVFSSAVYCARE